MDAVNSAKISFEPLRSLAFASVMNTYIPIGLPLNHPARCIKIANNTNANLFISFNGIDDVDFVYANGRSTYDFTANSSSESGYLEFPSGTRIYVRADGVDLPTQGSIYVTIIYATES